MKIQSNQYNDQFKGAAPKLSPEQMEVIKHLAECKTYSDGTVLLKAGEANFKFYILQKREIEVIDTSGSCPELILTHEPNEFTGDLANLFGRKFQSKCNSHISGRKIRCRNEYIFRGSQAEL